MKNRNKNILKALAITALVLLTAYLTIYFVFGSLLNEDERVLGWENSALVDEFGNTIVLEAQNTKKKPGAYNILVGSTDKGGTRTDSVMLIHYDTVEDEIACMSIPRDTYIATDRSSKKINTAYAYGKSDEFVAKTEETFGIDIDYYVIVDVDTFRNVVDAMGGVEVDVQFDMNYEDSAQDLSIHIKKGKQILMGEEAEGFVRYRKGYASADIARIDAQQIFLASAINKLKDNPMLIPKVITTAFEGIKTNIKQNNALKIVTSALDMDFSEIRMFKLPGTSASRNGVSYYSLYKDETLRIINEYFNTYKKDVKASQCAMIELKAPPEGYVYEDGKSLSEVADSKPPKKTAGFSSNNKKDEIVKDIPQTDVGENKQDEEVPDILPEDELTSETENQVTDTEEPIQSEETETDEITEVPPEQADGVDIIPPTAEIKTDMEAQSGQAGI